MYKYPINKCKIYSLYKTTNNINSKQYIGVHHESSNPIPGEDYNLTISKNKDSYLGSGTLLKKAIKKYGENNFSRVILAIGTKEYVYYLESKYVNKEFIKKSNVYNLICGGFNTQRPKKPKTKKKSKFKKNKPFRRTRYPRKHKHFNHLQEY